MAQLDYIQLFVALMTTMWLGGCGPVMIFGLYSRFGTTAGAWVSLVTGMVMAVGGMVVQRNWADHVYPWLEDNNLVAAVGNILSTVSSPLNPYVVWTMNPVKCPVNSYEIYMITMLTTLVLYCAVSWLTCKEPFNLDRMLHRGIYDLEGTKKIKTAWTFRTVFSKLIGITSEYSSGDKVIAWSFFVYSLIYKFLLAFVLVVVWNRFSPWPIEWWGHYFFIVTLLVPGIVAAISAFWFGIGGGVDLYRLFRDLRRRVANPLDDGRVEGHVSLADKAELEKVDRAAEK
ncbi:hypothetical protein SDC9_149918 [bioreactor metagenome]|uniref:Uncharacterized protein n=1 Tax=bioreactor metagenome TaxID=1076179 RepID=A0A645EN65_9ZZZZ